MTWFFAILIVLAMGAVAAVAAGYGTPLAEEYDDRPDVAVPDDGALRGADLRRVKFTTGFFGYRMDEVDALLRRLALELEVREAASGQDTPEVSSGPTPDVGEST